MRALFVAKPHDLARKLLAALAALCPYVGKHSSDALHRAFLHDERDLSVGIGRETVDRDHRGKPVDLLYIRNVAFEIRHAAPERRKILMRKLALRHAAVHFKRADGSDHHNGIGHKPRRTAFDVKKLFRPEVGSESRLGHGVIAEPHRSPCRDNGVAPVRDVCKRSAVNEHRRALERLHEIRLHRIAQQRRHSPGRAELGGGDGLIVICVPHYDAR